MNKTLCKHFEPISVQFALFLPEEIKKLSVAKLCIPLSFNALGHPLKGGVYDPALGPVDDRSDPCATCYCNVYKCSGHLGHIELPLPVYNPLFYRTIHNLLRMSCLTCYTLLIPDEVRYLLAAQLTLLAAGYVREAQDLEGRLNSALSIDVSAKDLEGRLNSDLSIDVSTKYLRGPISKDEMESYVGSIISATERSAGRKNEQSKVIESLRNHYLKLTIKKLGKKCTNCKKMVPKISILQNKMMTTVDKSDKSEIKHKLETTMIMPQDAKNHLQKIWIESHDFLKAVVPVLKNSALKNPTDALFFDVLPVTPPKTRPVNFIENKLIEHPQSTSYKLIIQDCIVIKNIVKTVQDKGTENLTEEGKAVLEQAKGKTFIEKLHYAWQELQTHVDQLMDTDTSAGSKGSVYGLKQVIEKKGGIIRMNMMGKRVNYAARSVITPDPNLDIDEIGIPETFATTLTYPVPVTAWNVSDLRTMVRNGPNVHPGAVLVVNEDGSMNRISDTDEVQRESLAKRLLTPEEKSGTLFGGVKIVHRHLQNGDILLLNRQPTLHRPSIMAHKARILKGEKTLRMNYANCKAYNADFDGDEMNAHFPQNELARSEAYNLVNVSNQYLVPKDGSPLSGLIQDHMVSGVRLSIRGRFFTREDYCGLVCHALPHLNGDIKLLRPSILKPITLWSGKQVLSTIIINLIPKGKRLITLYATAKISVKAWVYVPPRPWLAGGTPFYNPIMMSEAEVIIQQGELLCGVLDKAHYGATQYGLVHCIYELYGGVCATKLLSSFGKLFTAFLQIEGFTIGVEDILVLKKADKKRKKLVKIARKVGVDAVVSALDLTNPTEDELESKLSEIHMDGKWKAVIDRSYKTLLDSSTNDINKVCLPAGLLRKFPDNNLQLMVQSGAKGSTVNTMQISCLLGQIELEGKRPPLMLSGKSLPSFKQFDLSPRAGGFIDGRFMTGIKPQEFFFHCMAGREGLIDTAVKTSRSGYLQRCLVKHLEGLVVNYDLTVRDSDGSVIQFYYGEDGMDVMKAQFLNEDQLPFLAKNCKADKKNIKALKMFEDETQLKLLEKKKKEIRKWKRRQSRLNGKRRISGTFVSSPTPVTSVFQSDRDFGALTEHIESLIKDYLSATGNTQDSEFLDMMYFKSIKSHCPPGEPVGLLAAQSIGEPSTQMTLNTFHFAGRGEMNVTLGIPRLREILMMASKNIKTPSMEIPFLSDIHGLEKKAEKLKKQMKRTALSDVLECVTVTDYLDIQVIGMRQHVYCIKLQFLPHNAYKSQFIVKPRDILKYVENHFIYNIIVVITKAVKFKGEFVSTESHSGAQTAETDEDIDADVPAEKTDDHLADIARRTGVGEGHESSDEEQEAEDEDATLARTRSRHQENQEYDEAEDEECLQPELDENEIEVETHSNGIAENDDTKQLNENQIRKEHLKTVDARVNQVISKYKFVRDYTYDIENEMWCEVTLSLPLNFKRIDLSTLIKVEAEKAVVWEIPFIKKAFTYIPSDSQHLTLKTDGINISKMFDFNHLLDLDKLYSNDIYRVSLTYGIEAARMAIVKEVKDVFNMYGITVDPRHLLLIADYMTYEGTYESLNRTGMEDSCSPLQQMSFESSLKFLRSATLRGMRDDLRSPSSRIMLGRPCINGTGVFSVLQKLDILEKDLIF